MKIFNKISVGFVAGSLSYGGAERQLFYIVKTLHEHGIRVHVFCMGQGEYFEKAILELGIPVTRVGIHRNRILRLIYLFFAIRKSKVKILQSQHFHTNIYVSIISRLLRIQEIGAIRNNVLDEVAPLRVFGKVCLILPRLIAANSSIGIENAVLLGRPRSKLFLLPNVVDTDYFSPNYLTKIKDQCLQIVSIGRLVSQKRFDRLLRIASICKEKNLNFLITVYGDGILKEEILKNVTNLHLEENVNILGSVGDLRKVYQNADLLILTSDYEGTPNVILEAMACGIPVIATNVGGISDLVHHDKTGYLFDPNDERAIAYGIIDLASNPKKRMQLSENARNFILTNHMLRQLPVYLEYLYIRVLSNGN